MATHTSALAWRIPGTAEPGGLPSMGSHRVGHDWSDLAAAAWNSMLGKIMTLQERIPFSPGHRRPTLMWPRPPLTWTSLPAAGSFCHEASASTALCIYMYLNLCSKKSYVLLSIKLTSHNSLRFTFLTVHIMKSVDIKWGFSSVVWGIILVGTQITMFYVNSYVFHRC